MCVLLASSHLLLLKHLYLLILWVHTYTCLCVCQGSHVGVRKQTVGLFSLLNVGFRDGAQAGRLGRRHPHPLRLAAVFLVVEGAVTHVFSCHLEGTTLEHTERLPPLPSDAVPDPELCSRSAPARSHSSDPFLPSGQSQHPADDSGTVDSSERDSLCTLTLASLPSHSCFTNFDVLF